jgi:copper resistance protein C
MLDTKRILPAFALAASLLLGQVVPALAHTDLLSVVEQASAAGTQVHLTFSEAVELAFSKVTIRDDAGNEIEHGNLVLDPADSRVVLVDLAAPLSPGSYGVEWSVVSADGHKAEGVTTFEARQ